MDTFCFESLNRSARLDALRYASLVRKAENQDSRWLQVLERAQSADGIFVYGVKTTGVYCRPSCGSRHAAYERVEFFDTAAQAEEVGYRACFRCQPRKPPLSEQHRQLVAHLCRYIAQSEEPKTLGELAEEIGKSPSHTRRIFKAATGLSPKEYCRSELRRKVQVEIEKGASITDAIFRAGFNSTSRFYESSQKLLGMEAKAFRKGGKGEEIFFAVGSCSLGQVLVAATDKGVCAVLLGDDPEALIADLEARFPAALLIGGDSSFDEVAASVIAVVEAPHQAHSLPLDIRGSAFQERVWQALRKIPPGTKASYSDIAKSIGAPRATRAVASACGANHLAVLVPCHRVVRKDGSLSGYRWGIDRKQSLLELETLSVSTSS